MLLGGIGWYRVVLGGVGLVLSEGGGTCLPAIQEFIFNSPSITVRV
jgi:hypothetical protein